MKDIKITLKTAVKRQNGAKMPCMTILRKVAKDYALLALFVAVTAYLFLHIYCTNIIPALELTGGSFFSRLQLDAKDYGLIALFVAFFLATLYASLRAHRSMLRALGDYGKRELGGRRRTVILVESTTIIVGSFCVAAIPPFVLFCSAAASAASNMVNGAQQLPTWVIISFLLTAFAAVLFAEIIATFIRLCFREMAPAAPENDLPAAEDTPNVQQN